MSDSVKDRLPPLTALRAFEAAARHLSFASAAAELHVTPAALSQQIKSLESHLGAPVFRRLNRRVELTEVGQGLVPGVAEGFDALQGAWSMAVRRLNRQHLTVTSGPAFMASWLAPRMGSFVTAHPEVELRFAASLRLLSFDRDEIDLAIRFGAGEDEGYFSEELFVDWATPMVAPQLADKLTCVEDVFSLPMISQDSSPTLVEYEQWTAWCDAWGVDAKRGHGPVFTTPDAALTFAENGGGVVLGRIALAEHLLRTGRLVAPLRQSIRRRLRHRLVCPIGQENEPNMKIFREWVKREFACMDDLAAGREFA